MWAGFCIIQIGCWEWDEENEQVTIQEHRNLFDSADRYSSNVAANGRLTGP